MLYDSDCSMHEVDDADEVESEELLSNQPSTSCHGNHKKSREDIFTIQISPETCSVESSNRSKRSSGYISLSVDDPEAEVAMETSNDHISFHGASSRASSKSNLSILKVTGKQLLRKARSKSDVQFHAIGNKRYHGNRSNDKMDADSLDLDDYIDDSDDDDITLTSSRGHRRRQLAASFDPGGSGILSMWSAYSELLYEHDGISWDCCVSLIIAFCSSAQCRAYTTALKMAAWFVILILVLLAFRTYFYGTTFHGYTSLDTSSKTDVSMVTDHGMMDTAMTGSNSSQLN